MATEISNLDDVIDSRDVILRIAELEAERAALAFDWDEARAVFQAPMADDETRSVAVAAEDEAHRAVAAWDEDNGQELRTLQELAAEADGSPDWRYGETLIRESYFRDYAMQLADDIGAINSEATWPNNCIDWDRAARELQMDYTAVEFGGVTYLIRS